MQERPKLQRVDVGGWPIEFLAVGAGPPLVLLHGVGDSAHTWQRVLPDLARTHRVYAPSLPGFGRSAKPAVEYTPAFFTDFVGRFLDALDLPEAVLVGNSLGGLVAARFALAQPACVPSLVLVDSSGLGRDLHLALRLLTLPGYGRLVAAWNKTPVGAAQWALGVTGLLLARPRRAPGPWVREQWRMARLRGFLEATVVSLRAQTTIRGQRPRVLLLEQLPQLSMPILVVWGARDRIVPVAHGRDAVARLARGDLAVIPDCGHLPHLERPRQFLQALQPFLSAAGHARS